VLAAQQLELEPMAATPPVSGLVEPQVGSTIIAAKPVVPARHWANPRPIPAASVHHPTDPIGRPDLHQQFA